MMETRKYNWRFLLITSFVTAMGGYLFGFDIAVITGGLPFLRDQFGLDAFWEGITTGTLALGCIVGCVIAGRVADNYGRKPGLFTAASIFFVSSVCMGLAPSLSWFISARFFAGIGVGMASMLSPMFIAEIAPAEVRGRLVAINQLTIVLGQVITHFENYQLRNNGPDAWRWMFGLGTIPSFLFLAGVLILPESPRFLLRIGKEKEARKVLGRVGDHEFIETTVAAIQDTLTNEVKTNLRGLFTKAMLPLMAIGIGLAVFQQFCGINVVLNYTTNIFESIGANSSEQLLQAVWISLINLLFTLIAMSLVDKFGRRPLMMGGYGILSLLYIVIGYLLLHKDGNALPLFIFMATGTFAVTLGPLTWVLISEIFPNNIRGKAISVAVIFLWSAYFVLVSTFPTIEKRFGDAVAFWMYAGICAAGFLFIWLKLPETKGKSLETIENEYMSHKG